MLRLLQNNTLSDILSAEDGAPVFVPTAPVESYQAFTPAATDPLAGKPAFTAQVADAAANVQTMAAASTTALQAAFDATKPTGGLQGAWNWLKNQFTYGIPGLFTSASTRLRSLFGAPTTVTTVDAKSGATSTATASSSWLVYVLLAGAAAAVFFAVKGKKGKGGKIFSIPKLGAKSSVKLR